MSSDSGPTESQPPQPTRQLDSAGEVSWDLPSPATNLNPHRNQASMSMDFQGMLSRALAESQTRILEQVQGMISNLRNDQSDDRPHHDTVIQEPLPTQAPRTLRIATNPPSTSAPRTDRTTIKPRSKHPRAVTVPEASDSNPSEGESASDEEGPTCVGPDGLKYPLSHGLEYLMDLPEIAFGRRMAWITRSISRLGTTFAALAEKFATDPSTIDIICDGVESTISLAAMAQQQAEQPDMRWNSFLICWIHAGLDCPLPVLWPAYLEPRNWL